MERVIQSIRAKIPVFIRRSGDEQRLLECVKPINMKTFTSEISSNDIKSIGNSENDLHDLCEGKNKRSNYINEWQAGWNVTNAIQVCCNFKFKWKFL